MNQSHKNKLLQQYGSQAIVEVLAPYVTQERKARIDGVLAGRLGSLHLAMESPCDLNNALAAIRSAESLGVSHVHIIAPQADARLTQTITRGAVYWIDVSFYATLDAFIEAARALGLQLAGGVINATLPLADVPIDRPLCILVGNEQRGLTAQAIEACNIRYKIPMYGMTESLNMSVSAAISLYELGKRKRERLQASSDLTPVMQQDLLAQYYLNSTALRLAESVLKRFAVPLGG